MSERYYAPQIESNRLVTLDGTEAHHLLHVMRAGVGDSIVLFDGLGHEFAATVEQCGRREVQIEVLEQRGADPPSPFALTLAVALPKGDRQKWLVEKLTELNVARLIPIITERSVVDPRGKAFDKLERVVIEACKQCGRNRLMTMDAPVALNHLLADSRPGLRLLAHPAGEGWSTTDFCSETEITVLIGPEGGFSDGEVELARTHGWRIAKLGDTILRIETAAIAIAAAFRLYCPENREID